MERRGGGGGGAAARRGARGGGGRRAPPPPPPTGGARRGGGPPSLHQQLENHPLIPHAPRYPLAIQIFKQRNRILAADSRHIFEAGDINLRRGSFERGDLVAQIHECALVEDQLL